MFYDDGTFNFHHEIMALGEEFCQEWVQRQGPFESSLDGALVLSFALCTIKHDLEELLDRLESQPVFQGLSPRDVYERGEFGREPAKGLSDRDIEELLLESLRRVRRN
jgi:hypothetical protein